MMSILVIQSCFVFLFCALPIVMALVDNRFIPAPDLIRLAGYPVEVHHVTTTDGYVLELHRISRPSNPRFSDPQKPKKVALLMHCLFCSSAQFLLSGPNQALGYYLADANYDVWIGNFRGNLYSRRHKFLSPKNTKFWHFTLDEMAEFDLPAHIDYVLNSTNTQKLYYVGHSMGTTSLFAMMSLFPKYNEKIHVAVTMAPVASLSHCQGVFREILIYSSHMWRKIRQVLYHTPSGSSFRNAAYFGQSAANRRGRFQMFDFGQLENMERYGQPLPPAYNLKKVTIPVALIWGENDFIANPTDVSLLFMQLPNVIVNYKVNRSDYNHFDFLLAKNARKYVYKKVLDIIQLH